MELAGDLTNRAAIAVRSGDEILGSIWAAVREPLTEQRHRALADAAKVVALQPAARAGRGGHPAAAARRPAVHRARRRLGRGRGGGPARRRHAAAVRARGPADRPARGRPGTRGERSAALLRRARPARRPPSTPRRPPRSSAPSPTPCSLSPRAPPHLGRRRHGRGGAGRPRRPGLPGQGRPPAPGQHRRRAAGRQPRRRWPGRGPTPTGRCACCAPAAPRARRPATPPSTSSRCCCRSPTWPSAEEQTPTGPYQRLLAHDAEHGSELVATLRAYLDAFGDVNLASACVHVHANTFRYRLKRLIEISGLDLADPDARLTVMLQMRIFGP